MSPALVLQAISALAQLVKSFRKTHSWATEEERFGFESKIKKELNIIFDNNPDNDPEHWRKPFQYLEPGQEEGRDA